MNDTIKIPASTKNWRIVYDFLHQHLKRNSINHKELSHILLASEEIFVNISNYAYGGKNGNVIIKFSCNISSPIVIKIKFTDKGVKFNPTKVKKADVTLDFKQRKIGGLGLFIVYKVMNKVEYEYENSSNNLIITKIIK
ncbi:MAG: ATP-binding protein [Clostridia bacterium]|nr:ATP-binding protein [Clostridia bacterium]